MIALDHFDIQHRHLDDGAKIQAILLGDLRVRDAPEPVLAAADAGIALIGPQRIAAGRDKIDDARKGLARQGSIGKRRRHLAVQFFFVEGIGTGHAKHMLASTSSEPSPTGGVSWAPI